LRKKFLLVPLPARGYHERTLTIDFCGCVMEETSASLLERLREPNPTAAWERFVHLYTPLLCHWAKRLGVAGPDVDDLVQEVFTLLLQKMPAFQYDASQRFRAWLWTTVLNKHRERLRRNGAPERSLADLASEPATPDQLDALIAADYRQYLVQRALALMENDFQPATWRAFWECTVNERPAVEVAAELKLSLDAVYAAKSRVLRRLRAEMHELLD
jgi:RNA polymerase sigma-70 factor (ECF subfamily)